MFFVTMTWVPTIPLVGPERSTGEPNNESSPIIHDTTDLTPLDEPFPEGFNSHNLADTTTADGILDPVVVEQSGHIASGNISARTDSFENLGYDLPLDTSHDWIGSQVEADVWNLERLYVVNGTFNEGYPGYTVNPNGTMTYYPFGWSAISNNGDPGQVQQVSYEQSGNRYTTVQNTAKLTNFGLNQYTHYAGTNVTWAQTFENAPYTDQFLLQFNYLLLQGPLSTDFTGDYSLKVIIDDSVVSSIDLPTLSSRGIWYESGAIPVTIASPSDFMTFQIGIVIDSEFMVDADEDYDGDGSPDGAINTQFITVYLDDVSFIKETPPTPDQVQLQFMVDGQSSPLTGSMGIYAATIANASYWNTSPVSVSFSSNTSVSFEYDTRLLSHRFIDSTWRTDVSSIGVAYSVDHGFSSDLTFYAYVGYLGNYENPNMTIVFPPDWENLTISDPFLTDLTSSCNISTGRLIVPTSIINNPGWWEFKLESPNYAKSIKPQILDVSWMDALIFRIDDTTRADVTIGTETETLDSLTDVNVTWFKPTDEIWVTEILPPGGVAGQVYSTPQDFVSGASPAGVWWVEVYWTNGTEVAYDRTSFQVHHTANLVADPTEITTETGLTIKGLVRYTDGDTGDPILDASATLVGNWSGSSVPFVANPVQNWWEADFDTSIVGAGDFVIVVNASRPYYDDVNCQILVHSINVTRITSLEDFMFV